MMDITCCPHAEFCEIILGVYAAKFIMVQCQTTVQIKPAKNSEDLDFMFLLTINRLNSLEC